MNVWEVYGPISKFIVFKSSSILKGVTLFEMERKHIEMPQKFLYRGCFDHFPFVLRVPMRVPARALRQAKIKNKNRGCSTPSECPAQGAEHSDLDGFRTPARYPHCSENTRRKISGVLPKYLGCRISRKMQYSLFWDSPRLCYFTTCHFTTVDKVFSDFCFSEGITTVIEITAIDWTLNVC